MSALTPERIENVRYEAQVDADYYGGSDFVTLPSRLRAETVLALIAERANLIAVVLSEGEAADALRDADAFVERDYTGWLPTNAEAAQVIYAAGLAIVRVSK